MSSVNPLQGNRPVVSPAVVSPAQIRQASSTSTEPAKQRAADRLELSGLSPMLDRMKSTDVRQEKIAEIRQQLAEGTYETQEKIDAAVGKVIDELA